MDNTKSETKQMNDSFIDANNVRAAACCKWCARRTAEDEGFVCKPGGCRTYATDVCDLFSHVDEVRSCKCVMIEVLAECLDGKLYMRGWTEMWSPEYRHPDFCCGTVRYDELPVYVGRPGVLLNDDIDFVADRMTQYADMDDCEFVSKKDSFIRMAKSVLRDGGVKYDTFGNDINFVTIRMTALERIPDYVYSSGLEGRINAILENSVRAANGDELVIVPKRVFRVRYSRVDEGHVEIETDSASEAIERAKSGEVDGVWLQSDPDHICEDWDFDVED